MNEPYFEDDGVALYLGDCRTVLAGMEPDSVDAVCTDPPYDLMSGTGRGFMGARWDGTGVAFDPDTWRVVLRVMKPGAHLVAFGAPRTYHRLACAIEDAGAEIRDSLHWIQGAGFPKSLNVSAAIDRMAGAEREVLAEGAPLKRMIPGADQNRTGSWVKDNGREFVPAVTAPATEAAARWDGWGTACKPAHEPIVLARKPLEGTVAANVVRYGTGALNIDGCRVEGAERPLIQNGVPLNEEVRCGGTVLEGTERGTLGTSRAAGMTDQGRWPPNVLLAHSLDCVLTGTREVRGDGHHPASRGRGGVGTAGHVGQDGLTERYAGTEAVEAWDCAPGCPVAEMDRQSGVLTSGANPARRSSDKFQDAYGEFTGDRQCTVHRGADSGGASRFFPVFRYEAKASSAERPRLADGTAHSTVKPVALMSWLCRLVTRPGGLVLDPFAGSGTTGEACIVEGFRCILVEREPKYAELIKVRLSKPIQPGLFGGAA